MSVFRGIPETFPLNVSMKTRPVIYQLRVGAAERIATVLLSAFWSVLVFSVLFAWADPFSPWTDDSVMRRVAALGALILFCVFGIAGYLGPAALEALRTVDVEIGEADVTVRTSGIFGGRQGAWPLSEFEGLLIENWGTRSVGDAKIPVSAVMLKHRDDRWSIPIVIDGALRVKPAAAERKAEQLGLKLIDSTSADRPYAIQDDGRIVVNGFQALKVKGLYALISGGGLVAAIVLAWTAMADGAAAVFGLALLAFAAAVAMHLFVRRYVENMRATATHLEIKTPGLFSRTQRIAKADVIGVEYREGRGAQGTRHAVHAPWVKIRVRGRRLPFIVDMQSDYVSEAALLDLVEKPGREGP